MWSSLVLLLVSLILLTLGAELLVRGASILALRAGVSSFFVGMTIVGFGTSTPELATSIFAALDGSPEIAVGNVVGSNIANLTGMLGVIAIVSPIAVRAGSITREVLLLVAVTALPYVALATQGVLDRVIGVAFLLGLLWFVWWSYRTNLTSEPDADAPKVPPGWRGGVAWNLVLSIVGIAVLAGSSRLLVDSAVELATRWGVSELVVGLTIIAVGTSAPELVTSLVAQLRGRSDLGLGNLVGSGIFNVLGILGATALLQPTPLSRQIFWFDLPVAILVAAAMLPIMRTGRSISRAEGIALLAGFVLYTVALYQGWPAALGAAEPITP